jgi:hypothetical protein
MDESRFSVADAQTTSAVAEPKSVAAE